MPATRQPTPDQLDRFTRSLVSATLTYDVGLLDRIDDLNRLPRTFPRGWFIDRHRVVVGHGTADFAAACEGFHRWKQFGDDWLATGATNPPIRAQAEVGYAARFGFVYGTVGDHAERGEERFLLELDPNDDVVYSLLAVSRPGRWFSWPGLPITRRTQAKFRHRSSATMTEFIAAQRVAQA